MSQNGLDNILKKFHKNISSLNQSVPLVTSILYKIDLELHEKQLEFLKSKIDVDETGGEVNEEANEEIVHFEHDERQKLAKLSKACELAHISSDLVPRNFLVSLVSEFDAFIGSLIKYIYSKKPELLSGLERNITFSELSGFETIEDATQHILEKEVESILRKSHAEHFSIMENKFSIKLRTGLDVWPAYIELTERRNLFVHCDGVVSKQYLKVCKEHNADIADVKLADRLTADRKYLKQSFEVLYEISTKLVHVLWRKLFASERKYADSALNEIAYNLIIEKRFNLAISVLDFGLNVIKKHDNETIKRMMIINLALALKKNNEAKKSQNILKQYDWTAIGYEFKLAHSVLLGNYQEAAVLLNKVVSIGDLSEAEIIDWPVFEEFRETKDFRGEYQKLFGKEYEEKLIEGKIDKEEISNQVAKKVESEEISDSAS